MVEAHRKQTRITRPPLLGPSFAAFGIHGDPLLGDDPFEFDLGGRRLVPAGRHAAPGRNIVLRGDRVTVIGRGSVVFQILLRTRHLPLGKRYGDTGAVARSGVFIGPSPQGGFGAQKPHFGRRHQHDFGRRLDGEPRKGGVIVMRKGGSLTDAVILPFQRNGNGFPAVVRNNEIVGAGFEKLRDTRIAEPGQHGLHRGVHDGFVPAPVDRAERIRVDSRSLDRRIVRIDLDHPVRVGGRLPELRAGLLRRD